MKKLTQKGFTLIELMIVVAIIGILAAIAIPKFAQMMEKSREGATKGNIGALKSALSIYQGDWQGSSANNPLDWFSTGGSLAYIDNIPAVKVTGKNPMSDKASGTARYGSSPAGNDVYLTATAGSTLFTTGSNTTKGWVYDDGGNTYAGSATSYIYVYSTTVDSFGLSYTLYGY